MSDTYRASSQAQIPELLTPLKRSDLRVLPMRTPTGAVIEGLDVARSAEGLCIRIGRALIAMREQAGLSLEEMANDLRTSIVSVRKIEEGELRLSDIAAWEEVCNDEVACCPRSLVQDETLAREAQETREAAASPGTALATRAKSTLTLHVGTSISVPRSDGEGEEIVEIDRLVARLEQRAKTEARLLAEVADLRAEVQTLHAKGKQYREWIKQLGYNAL